MASSSPLPPLSPGPACECILMSPSSNPTSRVNVTLTSENPAVAAAGALQHHHGRDREPHRDHPDEYQLCLLRPDRRAPASEPPKLHYPTASPATAAGNLYIADQRQPPGPQGRRRPPGSSPPSPAPARRATAATAARPRPPSSTTPPAWRVDASGNLYIADYQQPPDPEGRRRHRDHHHHRRHRHGGLQR